MRISRCNVAPAAGAGVLFVSAAAAQPCEPGWAPGFERMDLDGAVHEMLAHDDGSGPALYVAGEFEWAGGVLARGIARWDGTEWSGVGGGVDGSVYSLCVYDDGGGPALCVDGALTLSDFLAFRNAYTAGCP